jgi:hypothetical protein
VLVQVALPIELGEKRSPHLGGEGPEIIRPRVPRPKYQEIRPVRSR